MSQFQKNATPPSLPRGKKTRTSPLLAAERGSLQSRNAMSRWPCFGRNIPLAPCATSRTGSTLSSSPPLGSTPGAFRRGRLFLDGLSKGFPGPLEDMDVPVVVRWKPNLGDKQPQLKNVGSSNTNHVKNARATTLRPRIPIPERHRAFFVVCNDMDWLAG